MGIMKTLERKHYDCEKLAVKIQGKEVMEELLSGQWRRYLSWVWSAEAKDLSDQAWRGFYRQCKKEKRRNAEVKKKRRAAIEQANRENVRPITVKKPKKNRRLWLGRQGRWQREGGAAGLGGSATCSGKGDAR